MMLEQFGHCPNQWWSLAILVKISMGKVYFTLLDYFYVFIMFALQSQTVSRGFALRQMRSRFFWYLFWSLLAILPDTRFTAHHDTCSRFGRHFLRPQADFNVEAMSLRSFSLLSLLLVSLAENVNETSSWRTAFIYCHCGLSCAAWIYLYLFDLICSSMLGWPVTDQWFIDEYIYICISNNQ